MGVGRRAEEKGSESFKRKVFFNKEQARKKKEKSRKRSDPTYRQLKNGPFTP